MLIPDKKPEHYINNSEFSEALRQYKQDVIDAEDEDNPKPPVPNYIGECFMKIANGLSSKPNFMNYSYRDEMIGDGIENCLMYFENFDPEKSQNPFAYFTQIIYYAFIRRIQKEKKQLYIKYKATENFGVLDEYEMLELGDGTVRQLQVYDEMYDFISKYEASEAKKKSANKQPKGIETFFEPESNIIDNDIINELSEELIIDGGVDE